MNFYLFRCAAPYTRRRLLTLTGSTVGRSFAPGVWISTFLYLRRLLFLLILSTKGGGLRSTLESDGLWRQSRYTMGLLDRHDTTLRLGVLTPDCLPTTKFDDLHTVYRCVFIFWLCSKYCTVDRGGSHSVVPPLALRKNIFLLRSQMNNLQQFSDSGRLWVTLSIFRGREFSFS